MREILEIKMIYGMIVNIPTTITNVGMSVLTTLSRVIVAIPHSGMNTSPTATAAMTPPAPRTVTASHAPEVRSWTSRSRVTEDVMQTTAPARS